MKTVIVVLVAALSIFMAVLGFNTLGWLVHRYSPELWVYTTQGSALMIPLRYVYFYGGILPLWSGGFLAGIIVGLVTHKRVRG